VIIITDNNRIKHTSLQLTLAVRTGFLLSEALITTTSGPNDEDRLYVDHLLALTGKASRLLLDDACTHAYAKLSVPAVMNHLSNILHLNSETVAATFLPHLVYR